MKYQGTIQARKVTVGGLTIKLDPYIFQQLADREDLPVVHGIKGIFNKYHVYLTVHDGITFYTKVTKPLLDIRISFEAADLMSYVRF